MKYLKKFNESNFSFTNRMGDNLYVEFDSTYEEDKFNSKDWFRNSHKCIIPSDKQISDTMDMVKSILGDKIVTIDWFEDFKQIYCYMWSNKEYMSYKERSESNRKGLIIDFHEDDWIFCAILDKNDDAGSREVHFACDGLDGLKNFLEDKKEYLTTK